MIKRTTHQHIKRADIPQHVFDCLDYVLTHEGKLKAESIAWAVYSPNQPGKDMYDNCADVVNDFLIDNLFVVGSTVYINH